MAPVLSAALRVAPTVVDLRATPDAFPPIEDQGCPHSCTAHVIAAALHFDLHRRGAEVFRPSRLFLYYHQRARLKSLHVDPRFGCPVQMREGIAAVAAHGFCPEELWPYDLARLDDPPSGIAEAAARAQPPAVFTPLPEEPTLAELRHTLVDGSPLLFGLRVFTNFPRRHTRGEGAVPLPAPDDRALGAHAVLGVGYDDAREVILIRNSWGAAWGDHGHATVPYAFFSDPNHTFDFWRLPPL